MGDKTTGKSHGELTYDRRSFLRLLGAGVALCLVKPLPTLAALTEPTPQPLPYPAPDPMPEPIGWERYKQIYGAPFETFRIPDLRGRYVVYRPEGVERREVMIDPNTGELLLWTTRLGLLPCDGRRISASEYPKLFALIGHKYD